MDEGPVEPVELIPADDDEESDEDEQLIVSDDGEEIYEAEDSILAGETEDLDVGMEAIPADDTEESDGAAELTPADDGPSANPIPDVPDVRENSDDRTRPAELLSSSSNIEARAAPVSVGDDINDRGEDGRTALNRAASCGDTELVKRLLEAGAIADVVESTGVTVLLEATWNGHTATMDFLLESGSETCKTEHLYSMRHTTATTRP